jgi:Peptidase M10 serralysin C terminal
MAITDKGDNTGNVFIDALAAYSFLDIGGDRNITYTFATGGNVSPHVFASTEKVRWQTALQQWVNVANITTQEVFTPDADLREAWVDTGTMTAAHGLGPDGLAYASYHDLPRSSSAGPNGMYNRAYNTSFYPGFEIAASGYWTFIKEIGRGLGLTPPFGTQDLENEPLFPGVTSAGDLGAFGYNQMVYTVLSPNRGQYVSGGNTFGYPVTPMAFDIAAIQFLYGPNTTFHSGSDGYGLPDVNEPGTNWQCIWDTGGTDTIVYDGKKNATIDLRAATLANGDPIAGGAISKVDGVFGGLTIANGVVIENASGGSGNDRIVGSAANNVLNGNAGDDTVVYFGNKANYTIQNLADRIVISGPDGTDTLFSIEHVEFAAATAAPVSSPDWSLTGVRDLDGDGTSDVVWYNAITGKIDLWKIDNGQWAGSVDLGSHPLGWQPAGLGDLTGDGTGDVLWHNPSTGNAELWKIVNGQWAGSVDIGSHPLGWQPAGLGDLNGDGTGDLLWFNPSTGNADLWKIVNGQWAGSVDVGAHPPGYQVAGVGDFDHDGTNDVLWFNPSTGNVDLWKISNGQWAGSVNLGSHPLGYQVAGVGDFNHDGTSDIAWYNPTTRDIDIWQIANGQWSASFGVGSHPLGWTAAGVGEFNGDGFSDIAWHNSASGNIEIWQIVNAHWAASVNVGAHPLG